MALCATWNPNKEHQKLLKPSKVSGNNWPLFHSLLIFLRRCHVDFPNYFHDKLLTLKRINNDDRKRGQKCAVLAEKGLSTSIFLFVGVCVKSEQKNDNEEIIVLGWKSGFFQTRSQVCLMSDVSALRNVKRQETSSLLSVFKNAICMRTREENS